MELLLIFLTGLTVGGLTCLAIQGGLLAALISEREKENITDEHGKKETLLPTISFVVAKFIAYVILGFILGLLGQTFSISEKFQSFMQLFAGIYMFAVALNLLNVHPIFRYVIIQPPKFITRRIRNTSRSRDTFAPAMLGFMTIFIPCGTTLAMEVLAVSSGSPFKGALIMGTFVLGTVPLFFGLGYVTTLLGNAFKTKFLKFAAILLIFLGFLSINGALVALGSSFTVQNLTLVFTPSTINTGTVSKVGGTQALVNTIPVVNGVQTIDINILSNGYRPNYIIVRANEPVRLNLVAKGGLSCAAFFRIPELGIKKDVLNSGKSFVEFTPTKKGKIRFTCSMGMYDGVIEVI